MINQLVSVNITTYNRAHLLSRCLDSVISQSYGNMEIIIVDDCSSDNTTEIVKAYQEKDNRIKYIKHKTNQKLPAARNTAWGNSKGKYIAFMDDDDVWIDKHKIKKQVEIFESRNDKRLALLCTGVRLYTDKNNYIDRIIQKPDNLKSHILSRNGIMYTPTVMTKRDILIEIDGFDQNLTRGIDSEFYRMCIVKFGYDVYFMEAITTQINEYGADRITLQNNKNSLIKTRNANAYLIIKYKDYYFKYPKAFLQRLVNILIAQLNILRVN